MTTLRSRLVLLILCVLLAPLARAAGTSALTNVSNLHFGDFLVLGSCANCEITINAVTGARTRRQASFCRPAILAPGRNSTSQ